MRIWKQLLSRGDATGEYVRIDGHVLEHQTCYESENALCELCHDWGLLYNDVRESRMDGVHTSEPRPATHLVILSIGSKKSPRLACDACKDRGLGAVSVRWGWDGSVDLGRYRLARGWNRASDISYSEC